MKYSVAVIVWICCASSIFHVDGFLNECTEHLVKTCGECISIPGCAWCEDPEYSTGPHVIVPRCDSVEQLSLKQCVSIHDPKSIIAYSDGTKNGKSTSALPTQLNPQVINVQLKAGGAVDLDLTFQQAESYPVDLYYLLDLSNSMKDDLQTLRDVSQQLGETMQNRATNFNLGLGSFVDKPIKPYTHPNLSRAVHSCPEKEECVTGYSFRNELSLTPRMESFSESLINVNISSNGDTPQGALDAMMQAIVCQGDIKWRKQSYRLLVLSTDAPFHYAGDGKLAGIDLPNDGICHLNKEGEYIKATEMDYPSIGHLAKEISEHDIHLVFAVSPAVAETYKELQKVIPGSFVGITESGSTNIISLIESAYRELKAKVQLEMSSSEDVKIENKKSHCRDGIIDGLQCNHLTSGDKVNFTFTLSSENSFLKPTTIRVSPYGYDEEVIINVTPLKECNCSEADEPGRCNGNGKYECGTCLCDAGYTKLDCSCEFNGPDNALFSQEICKDPISNKVCNNNGECHCGNCICKQQYPPAIGKYCEKGISKCPSMKGNVCNGKGNCQNQTCICNKGWSGNACECTGDYKSCVENGKGALNDIPCNGNGVCKCGVCQCNETPFGAKYRGQFCDRSPILKCSALKDCIQCKAFGTGRYSDAAGCQKMCKNYEVTVGCIDPSRNQSTCRFSTDGNEKIFDAYYHEVKGFLVANVSSGDCLPHSIPYSFSIFSAIAVGIVLFIELSVYVWMEISRKMKEYRNLMQFVEVSQSANQQEDVQPQEYFYNIRYVNDSAL